MLSEKQIKEMAGLIVNGSPELALKEVNRFSGKKTNDTRLYLIKGDALKRLGRPLEAGESYRQAAQAGGPNAAAAWFSLRHTVPASRRFEAGN